MSASKFSSTVESCNVFIPGEIIVLLLSHSILHRSQVFSVSFSISWLILYFSQWGHLRHWHGYMISLQQLNCYSLILITYNCLLLYVFFKGALSSIVSLILQYFGKEVLLIFCKWRTRDMYMSFLRLSIAILRYLTKLYKCLYLDSNFTPRRQKWQNMKWSLEIAINYNTIYNSRKLEINRCLSRGVNKLTMGIHPKVLCCCKRKRKISISCRWSLQDILLEM